MMTKNRTLGVLLAGALLAPASAFAAGYQLNETAANATGRLTAVAATVDDASAVFYNPAGLTNIKGTDLQLGVTLFLASGAYEGTGYPAVNPAQTSQRYDTLTTALPVPNFYLGRALTDKAYIGFGVYTPYGLGLNWGDDQKFVGRTTVQEIELQTVFFTPTIALKLHDRLSIAMGVSIVPASVYLRRTLGAEDNNQVLFPADLYGSEGTVQLSGHALGVGATVGIQATPIDHLKLGLTYHSAVALEFTGNAHFNIPATAPVAIRANFPDGTVSTSATLPHSFQLGVGWAKGPLTIEADANMTLWAAFDSLDIYFDSRLPTAKTSAPRNWKASPTFRLGGQYDFGKLGAVGVRGRLGAGFDVSPIPDTTVDPTLPDNARILFSGGLGLLFGPVNFDASYMGVFVLSRDSTSSVNFAAGTYPGRLISVIGVSAGIAFN
ncbi:MAG: outer membrane protein transport protein [Myxococcota bacterium]